MTAIPKNALCWHLPVRPREISFRLYPETTHSATVRELWLVALWGAVLGLASEE